SRTWYLSYTIAGEDRRDPLGKYSDLTLDEARALVQRRRRDLAEGTIDPRVVKAQQAAESIACKTLREAALAYLAKHSAGWSESTRRGHERYLVGTDVSESYFKALLDTPIKHITREQIAVSIGRIMREHSKFVAKQARTSLREVYKFACGEGWVSNS